LLAAFVTAVRYVAKALLKLASLTLLTIKQAKQDRLDECGLNRWRQSTLAKHSFALTQHVAIVFLSPYLLWYGQSFLPIE
jgi:hypothetical protein